MAAIMGCPTDSYDLNLEASRRANVNFYTDWRNQFHQSRMQLDFTASIYIWVSVLTGHSDHAVAACSGFLPVMSGLHLYVCMNSSLNIYGYIN